MQTAGTTGLVAYTASTISNAPLALSFEAYSVAAAPSSPPPPTASYYVSPTGNDANAGTVGTLADAPESSRYGARRSNRLPAWRHARPVRHAPIRHVRGADHLHCLGGETAVVDGKMAVAYTIKVVGAQYLRFTNLTIRGGYANGYAGAGITTENSGRVEIRNNLITDNKAWGVRLYNSTT